MSHIVGELWGVGTRKATCTRMTPAAAQPCQAEIAQVTGMAGLSMHVAELKAISKK